MLSHGRQKCRPTSSASGNCAPKRSARNRPRDDYVFCHKDGTPIHTFKKGFETLITEAGVETDRDGEKRTIVSLRHTYATFRLQEGVNHYVLARNMGTSVKMLENFYGHTSNRAMADELTKMKAKRTEGAAVGGMSRGRHENYCCDKTSNCIVR